MKHFPTLDCTILDFTKDGLGLGQIAYPNEKISLVEVPFTMPGDQVQIQITKKNKGTYQSRLLNVVTPSPKRITPKCIHFGSCGGCKWQEIPYDDQLQQKQKTIQTLFSDFLNKNNCTLYPILPCLPPWNYRNKMEFSFSQDLSGNHYLGLVLLGSRGRVFNMEECHLVNPWFVDALKSVNKWWESSGLHAYHPGKNSGSLRTLTVREGIYTGDRMVMLTVSGNPDFALNKKQLDNFKESVIAAINPADSKDKQDAHLSLFLRIHQSIKGEPTNFYEMHLSGPDHIREKLHVQSKSDTSSEELLFHISPTAFFQPNTRQAEKLYSRALQLIDIPKDGIVYDLYCGTGTLGICASKHAKEVIGIEIVPESVLDARENIKLNEIENVTILEGDVGKVLEKLIQDEKKYPQVVMVDPPRAGLDKKAIQHLLKLRAPTILYISCNPYTQVENVKELTAEHYSVKCIQPVDQFPHTAHMENIVVMKRKT